MSEKISRRAMLGLLFGSNSNFDSNLPPIVKSELSNSTLATVPRRGFLQLLAGLGLILGLGEVRVVQAEDKLHDNEIKAEIVEKTLVHLETGVEQSLLTVAHITYKSVLKKFGTTGAQASKDHTEQMTMLQEHPIEFVITVVAIMPTVEEAVFRLLPSYLVDSMESDLQSLVVGLPAALVFAAAHLNLSEFNNEMKFGEFLNFIPVTQFINGLFFWYLMRERGFSHSLLAHSTNNAIAITLAMILLPEHPKNP